MAFTIQGDETRARIHGPEEAFDDYFFEQVEEMVDHPAFTENIEIMPDGHGGAGAVIGFTKPVEERVVPNTVGVDIGCGMTAIKVGYDGQFTLEEIDDAIHEVVPMGRNVHSRGDYHIVDDFPWGLCEAKLTTFEDSNLERGEIEESVEWFDGYGKDYFLDLCKRVEYDTTRAINSVGTLGGGNHFVEFSEGMESGDHWFVVHSGSRGIGLSIANYWQDKATHRTTSRKNLEDVPEHIREYMNGDWKPKADKIREDFDGPDIQQKFDEVSMAIHEYGPSADNRNTDLDWLEGEERYGYFLDMIFAQTYAEENRIQILLNIVGELGFKEYGGIINSTHNYIDFKDGVIRKGATRSHRNESLIIPLNMAEGTLYCEGSGNEEWNRSAPHGAGRRMSRTEAHNTLSMEEYEEAMRDVFSTSVSEETLDEAPQAYKDISVIEEVIGQTAPIQDWWKPLLNVKADQ